MTEGEFRSRSFTMRAEGYDRSEVDSYINELQRTIAELRRAADPAPSGAASAVRLHDPEGAVTRTLAIAQETADRLLHDAEVEAERRRVSAEAHATSVIAGADERAARLLADMEVQAAEVREQGIAAARSAIQVERDKAMFELDQVRTVRDALRSEAASLKTALDGYRSQARDAAEVLSDAASGPLTSIDLPDFVDADAAVASSSTEPAEASDASAPRTVVTAAADEPASGGLDAAADESATDVAAGGHLRAVDDAPVVVAAEATDDAALAAVISIADTADDDIADDDMANDDEPDDDADASDGLGGTFLAEVRAAAEEDVALAPEDDDSDRFLSELRGIAGRDDDTDDAADRFFDGD